MAMTGKHAGSDDPVTITAAMEEEFLERLHHSATYSGDPVEFHCCSDGLLACVPVSGWSRREGEVQCLVLCWPERNLRFRGNYLDDLRAIYEKRAHTEDKIIPKQLQLQEAAIVPGES